jgi:predicted Zn-dependent peptidase
MIQYQKINDFIHLNYFSQPDIKKLEIEIVLHHGGSFFESKEDRGKKHLMEHCIATRTTKMNKDEFKDYQFANNMMFNAFTSPMHLGVNVTTHIAKFYEALDITLEMIFAPTFDQIVLDQEKEIVLREITERRGSPDYKAWFFAIESIFDADSIENHQTLGDAEMVAQTTVVDLVKLHKENLSSSHILINITGPNSGGDFVDLEYLKSRINHWMQLDTEFKTALNQLPKVELNYKVPSEFLDKTSVKLLSADFCHQESELQIFLPCKYGYDDLATLKIFSELYLKFYGKVYDKLRDQKGYIYSMQSEFRPRIQCVQIIMSCEMEYIQPIINEIKEIFSDFESSFDERKFNQFKEVMYLKTDLSTDEPDIMFDFMNYGLLSYSKVRDIYEYTKQIENVTKEQVGAIFNSIKEGWKDIRVVATSKNPEIEKLEIVV